MSLAIRTGVKFQLST